MPHLRPLGRRILAGAKRVVFLSRAYREGALKPYLSAAEAAAVDEKAVVLPNGIGDVFHANRGEPKARPHAPVRFLFVGQLVPRKNVASAIEAVRRVRSAHEGATLTVVGEAVNKRELSLVEACPFAAHRPPVAQRALIDIYRSHDIFIVPSKTETFGLVYPEAMSQGMPVLYTRGQGFDGQYAPGEVGYPVPANDPAAIARAAEALLADFSAASARAVAASARYDWSAIARAYAALYEEAVR
jgi:glycosyltransferase involved in cell wall biosynthesis